MMALYEEQLSTIEKDVEEVISLEQKVTSLPGMALPPLILMEQEVNSVGKQETADLLR